MCAEWFQLTASKASKQTKKTNTKHTLLLQGCLQVQKVRIRGSPLNDQSAFQITLKALQALPVLSTLTLTQKQ